MTSYLPRTVDLELDELMGDLPAISLEGPRGVGKTATAQRRAETTFALDDPDELALLAGNPGRLDRSPHPALIDEWQRYPTIWDWVRRSVDRDPSGGRFILTGSASPVSAPTHSGAGRIVSIRMRPMSLAERGEYQPTVSLRDLLTDTQPSIEGDTDVDLPAYTDEILRSGFPAIRDRRPRTQRAQLDGYLTRIVERDFPEQGHLIRQPATLRAWLAAYAAATATTASYNTILDAATPGETHKPAKTTTTVYREVLSQIWLLDPVPGWLPSRNPFVRPAQAPKHHLADPALAARLLGATEASLLTGRSAGPQVPRDGTLLGALFESLVALNLRVYSQSNEATVYHLRTFNGRQEVDFIVERDDRKIVAFETKLAPTVDDSDVVHLHWLREQFGELVLDLAVINTGKHAYRRQDGIAIIPACLLGP